MKENGHTSHNESRGFSNVSMVFSFDLHNGAHLCKKTQICNFDKEAHFKGLD